MRSFSFTVFLALIAIVNVAISKFLLETPVQDQPRFKRATNLTYVERDGQCRDVDNDREYMHADSAWDNCNTCDCRNQLVVDTSGKPDHTGQPGYLTCILRSCTTEKCPDADVKKPINTLCNLKKDNCAEGLKCTATNADLMCANGVGHCQ